MAARQPTKTFRAKKSPAKAKSTPRKSSTAVRSLALSSASPSFTVNDLEKSLAWYRDVVGFDRRREALRSFLTPTEG
jgi:hypothetical protein